MRIWWMENAPLLLCLNMTLPKTAHVHARMFPHWPTHAHEAFTHIQTLQHWPTGVSYTCSCTHICTHAFVVHARPLYPSLEATTFHKQDVTKIFYVPKKKESHTSWANNMRMRTQVSDFLHFWVNYPFKKRSLTYVYLQLDHRMLLEIHSSVTCKCVCVSMHKLVKIQTEPLLSGVLPLCCLTWHW